MQTQGLGIVQTQGIIECMNTNIACSLQEPGKGEPPAVLAPADGDQDFWLVRDLKGGLLT